MFFNLPEVRIDVQCQLAIISLGRGLEPIDFIENFVLWINCIHLECVVEDGSRGLSLGGAKSGKLVIAAARSRSSFLKGSSIFLWELRCYID